MNNEIAVIDPKNPSFNVSICPKMLKKDARLDPALRFNKEHVSGLLSLQWELTFQNQASISDPVSVLVLAEDIVYWDLKRPDGTNVPFDFILASLTAWPLAQNEAISARGSKYLDPDMSMDKWMENCYQDLFANKRHRLVVDPYEDPWPPAGKNGDSMQTIKTPQEALQVRKVNSLEAALLVSALEYSVFKDSQRLVLLALPAADSDNPGAKQFLLAWPKKKDTWEAIDLTAPNGTPFQQNLASATARLDTALKSAPILKELGSGGIYIAKERRLLAIDFLKAAQVYQIKGPP